MTKIIIRRIPEQRESMEDLHLPPKKSTSALLMTPSTKLSLTTSAKDLRQVFPTFAVLKCLASISAISLLRGQSLLIGFVKSVKGFDGEASIIVPFY